MSCVSGGECVILRLKLVVFFSGPARDPGLNWLHNSLAVQFHDRDAHSIIRFQDRQLTAVLVK
jgi:hypothetical protein